MATLLNKLSHNLSACPSAGTARPVLKQPPVANTGKQSRARSRVSTCTAVTRREQLIGKGGTLHTFSVRRVCVDCVCMCVDCVCVCV